MVKKNNQCICCLNYGEVDQAHIKSKGSGGSTEELNMISLCRKCHTTQHQLGWRIFLEINPRVSRILRTNGWKWEYNNKRFIMWLDKQ